MHQRAFPAVIAAVTLIFLLSATGYCQVSTASINGTVSDPQGAIVIGAQLVLTNVQTSVEQRTSTNESGLYRFQNLTVGKYTLAATASGFQTKRLEPFTLQVGQVATLDFVLQVGAVSEQVTVEAAGVQVQSASAELGTVVEQKHVVDLPLNGRNFTQMLMLQPGVNSVSPGGTQSMSYTRAVGAANNPSVNGQNNRANIYLLDGILNIETFGNAYAVPPIVDAIQEFKVQSHNDSSEIGMAAGGTINVATKSGTNELHGTTWYFGKNDAFNARNFFLSRVQPFKQHQFGATGGGPIYLPKLYNGRNRSFFFLAYQGFRFRTPATSYFNVPTEAMLRGDFSAEKRQLYDPSTTRYDPNNPARIIRDPFPGNQISAARIDPRMLAYVQTTVPKPTTTDRPQFNQVNNAPRTDRQDEYQVRGDHMLNERNMFWFRFSGVNKEAIIPGRTNLQTSQGFLAKNTGASWVHTFGPTSTLQVQWGLSRVTLPDRVSFLNVPSDFASKLGMGAGLTEYKTGGVTLYPGFNVANWFSGGENYTVNRPADNWQLKANYSKIVGAHTIKTGGEFVRADMGMIIDYHGVDFREYETADPMNSAATGNSVASLLLNAPTYSTRRDLLESLRFGGAMGAYLQDSWKMNQKLTVNFGLRYDYTWIPPFGKVKDNNIFTGNMDTDSGKYTVIKVPESCAKTGKAPCIPTPDGKLPDNIIASPDETIMHGSKYMFGPRFGFGYRMFQNTAIRGSFGMFYDSWAGVYQSARGIGGNWPMVATTMYGNLNNPTPSQPFPGVKVQDEFLGATLLPPALPWAMEWWYMDPKWKNGYSLQWNFGIQHQLSQSTVAEVNYVGSGGRRLDLGARRNTAVVPGPGDPKLRQRFPYMNPTYMAKSVGRNSYNAMQFSLKRSFASGLGMTVAYTWSKSIDIACSGFFGTEGCAVQDEYHLDNDRSISAYDVPHNLVVSWVYELPIGRGKQLSTGSRVLDYAIGGWQFNGIANLRNGIPFYITVPGDLANIRNTGTYLRPNVVGDWHVEKPTVDRWFNTAAFAAPPLYSFGNMGRNTLRPDWVRNFDLSLFRQFPIRERTRFELRLESFNSFNTPMFGNPGTNLADSRLFGKVTGLQVGPRNLQLGAKMIW